MVHAHFVSFREKDRPILEALREKLISQGCKVSKIYISSLGGGTPKYLNLNTYGDIDIDEIVDSHTNERGITSIAAHLLDTPFQVFENGKLLNYYSQKNPKSLHK